MKSASKQFPVDSTVTDSTTGATYTDFYDIFTIGAGYLDIQAALNDLDTVPATLDAASPAANYDPATGNVYLTPSDGAALWDSSIIWGDSLVWGSAEFSGATLSGQSIIWGDSVVWGDVTQDGFSILWGSTVIWGSSDQGNALSTLAGGDN
jgi:serine protease AprX